MSFTRSSKAKKTTSRMMRIVALFVFGGIVVGSLAGGILTSQLLREDPSFGFPEPMAIPREELPIKTLPVPSLGNERIIIISDYDFFAPSSVPECDLDKPQGRLCGRGQTPVYLMRSCSANGQEGRMFTCEKNDEQTQPTSNPLITTEFGICGDGICDSGEQGCSLQACGPGEYCGAQCSHCALDCGELP